MGCSCGWRSYSPFDLTRIFFSTRVIGGFIRTSKVPILCQWRTDLISNKHCLPCNDWNTNQKETHKCPRTLTENNNGHRVLLLIHGGIGKVHGGLLILVKVTMEMHQVLTERGDLLNAVIGKILLNKTFLNSIHFVYRWIVYSWRRSTETDGECKHNTSNDPFSRCNSVQ